MFNKIPLIKAYTEYTFLKGFENSKDLLNAISEKNYDSVLVVDRLGPLSLISLEKENSKLQKPLHLMHGIEIYIIYNERNIPATFVIKNQEGFKDINTLILKLNEKDGDGFIEYADLTPSKNISVILNSIDLTFKNQTLITEIKELYGDLYYFHKFQISKDFKVIDFTTQQNLDISNLYKIPGLPSMSAILSSPRRWQYLDLLYCIEAKSKIGDINRNRPEDNIHIFNYSVYKNCVSKYSELIVNSLYFKSKHIFKKGPREIKIKPIHKVDAKKFLISKIINGLMKVKENYNLREAFARIMFELRLIVSRGFEGYFYNLYHLLSCLTKNNISYGPGRGSAGGSFVCYLLKITKVCPIKYGLFFERFLNSFRKDYADIDIDVCQKNRNLALNILDNYLNRNVAHICTFSQLSSKACLRDCAKTFGLSVGEQNNLTKLLPVVQNKGTTLVGYLKEVKEFKELILSRKQYKEIARLGIHIENTKRNIGVHAAGLVIDNSIQTNIPLIKTSSSPCRVALYDMYNIEYLGYTKYDFLGLRNISLISETVNNIRNKNAFVHENHKNMDWTTLDYEDPKVFRFIRTSSTEGLFQFSRGIQGIAKSFYLSNMMEISDVLALYRPGQLKAGMHKVYIDNKNNFKNGRPIKKFFLSESINKILRETSYIILYQEQIMQICTQVAKMTLDEGDMFRRAIAKKNKVEFDENIKIFEDLLQTKGGLTKEEIDDFIPKLEEFSRYCFNKSHSVSYAHITYFGAYLKCYYPSFYLCSLINSYDLPEKKAPYICEALYYKIRVVKPKYYQDVTYAESKTLYLGMDIIKNISKDTIQSLKEAKNIKHTSLRELIFYHKISKPILKILLLCDVFNSFPDVDECLYEILELKTPKQIQDAKLQCQTAYIGVPLCIDYRPIIKANGKNSLIEIIKCYGVYDKKDVEKKTSDLRKQSYSLRVIIIKKESTKNVRTNQGTAGLNITVTDGTTVLTLRVLKPELAEDLTYNFEEGEVVNMIFDFNSSFRYVTLNKMEKIF